jgi:2-deoxy-D-gluconate 3-dehydrogenase
MSKKILSQFCLSEQKSIIVGGAGDLGYAMVEALVEAGSEAVIIDLDEKVFTICENLKNQGYKVHAIKADVSDRTQIRSSFETALKLLDGTLNILINSAGIQRRYPSEVFPEKDWDDVIAINLEATFFYCQLAANVMIPNGGGKIVNIASMMSFFGGITIPAYAASKGGVSQLTKALSNDWASKGITVNAIAPGYMDTQLNVALINDPKRNAEALNRIPMNRWGKGDDLKGLTVFLSSHASDYISGTVIPVDGGYLAR